MTAHRTVKTNTDNLGGIAKLRNGVTFYVTYLDANNEAIGVFHDTSTISVKEMLAGVGVDIHDALIELAW